jgi:hypothetical protein
MATFQSIFIPSSPAASTLFNGSIAASGNATVVLAPRTLFAIAISGGTANIRFGNATKVPAAAATDWPVFASSVQEWEMGEEFDRLNIFNGTGGSITYWVYVITRS